LAPRLVYVLHNACEKSGKQTPFSPARGWAGELEFKAAESVTMMPPTHGSKA
jgi:hypothetical protein